MTQAQQALFQLWRQLKLPVYAKGCVPRQAQLPYLVMEPALAAPLDKAVLTLEAWYAEPGAMQAAAAMLDQVAALLPPGGLLLPVGQEGLMVLYRAPGVWQEYIQDRADSSLMGIKCRYEVHFHLMEGA